MNVEELTEGGLRGLHTALKDALAEDDRIPEGQDKRYGVRRFADFRQMVDLLERELDGRGLTFEKINW